MPGLKANAMPYQHKLDALMVADDIGVEKWIKVYEQALADVGQPLPPHVLKSILANAIGAGLATGYARKKAGWRSAWSR
jgi:hypothetical protein